MKNPVLLLAAAASLSGAQGASAAERTVVPAAERLTFAGVVADASIEVQAVMAVLALASLGALGIWATSLDRAGQGDAGGLSVALGRLRIVRSGGALLGALTATYVLFCMFVGMANVRPTPTIAVLAPGWAEAALALMLGLLATSVAVLCERHLEARIAGA